MLSLGFVLPTLAPAGVVAEKGSEYILAHTGPRELDGYPLGGCGSGFWSSSRLYYPFGKARIHELDLAGMGSGIVEAGCCDTSQHRWQSLNEDWAFIVDP